MAFLEDWSGRDHRNHGGEGEKKKEPWFTQAQGFPIKPLSVFMHWGVRGVWEGLPLRWREDEERKPEEGKEEAEVLESILRSLMWL